VVNWRNKKMKMVKGLLLGSAAGVMAIAGAQAADLPVKAKPVEYVKVCSLYGVGYYYVPGSDVCLRVGGYVRAEYSYHYGGNMTNSPFAGTPANLGDAFATRTDGQELVMRSRAYITTESRQQTAYGTLRTFLNVGLSFDNPSPSSAGFSANRAFIQIAGFTIGLATSYYDFYSAAASQYLQIPNSDTGDSGWKVFAYTAQLGNGWSATLSLEEPRRSFVVNTDISGAYGLINPAGDAAKTSWPDIVANLRVDQAWGSAQVMGAIHDSSGGYYGTQLGGAEINGHPDTTIGWAVGAGLKINFPMIAPGDFFQMQVNYAQGAGRYVGNSLNGSFNPFRFSGDTLGFGLTTDAVFCGRTVNPAPLQNPGCNGTGVSEVELTTQWGVNASYEHFWTPSLRTSLYGGYMKVEYNDAAKAIICDNATFRNTNFPPGPPFGGSNPAAGNWGLTQNTVCNPGYSQYGFGSRTQWNVTKDFYMGVDVYYLKLQPEMGGEINYTQNTTNAKPSGVYLVEDQDIVGTRIRFHRDINP
jgi:hypothetical protein